jgi:hypothetical protein
VVRRIGTIVIAAYVALTRQAHATELPRDQACVVNAGRHERAPYNVMVIVLEGLGRDAVSYYAAGRGEAWTPELDRFGREGLVFMDGQGISAGKGGALGAILRGTNEAPDTASSAALAERFRERGYRTAAFFAGSVSSRARSDLAAGFQYFQDDARRHPLIHPLTSALIPRLPRFSGFRRILQPSFPSDDVVDRALSWVFCQPSPWFAAIDLRDARVPRNADAQDLQRFRTLDPERAELLASAMKLDRAFAVLLERLKEQGLRSTTVIAVVSPGSGASDERIPLFIQAPGLASGSRDDRVETTALPGLLERLAAGEAPFVH